MQLHVRQHNSCKCNICSCQGAYGRGLPEVVPVILPCPFQPCQQMNCAANMRPARLALRLEPCNVQPTNFPAAANGLSCASVFMRFLHYFHSFIPSSGTEKAPGPQMQPRQTCAPRALLIGFIIAMSLTYDQTCLFIALSAFFLLLHPISSAQKKRQGIMPWRVCLHS